MNSSNEENSIVEFTETFQLSKFQINVLASLLSVKPLNNVSISCIAAAYVVIAVDEKLSVFKEECQELFWEFEFDSEIYSLTLSENLGLLVVVENNNLHLLHLPSKTIWSTVCENDGCLCTVEKTFICPDISGAFSIYVYTKEGILFEMSNIDSTSLNKALVEEKVSEFFSGLHFGKIKLDTIYPDLSLNSVFEAFCQVSPLGLDIEKKISEESVTEYYAVEDVVERNFMSDMELNNENGKFKLCNFSGFGKMKKIVSTRDSRYIICLNEKHKLSVFSSFTLLNMATWGDEDIQDFVLYETLHPNNFSLSDCKIGLLLKSDSAYIFEIKTFPSFEFFHRILLSEFVRLVESKPNQESWYIIEGHEHLENEKSAVLKIVCISDSQPEARLSSLLTRRKFKEAIKYAKMHNLNDEIIFKTKIDCMFKDYSSNANLPKDELEYAWKMIEESLNKIKDVEFVKSWLDFIPDIDVMKRFLSVIHHWVVLNNIEGAEDLIHEVNKRQDKLVTYSLLPASSHLNLSVEDFLTRNLLQYVKTELISGGLVTASIVWKRHKTEFLPSLTSEQVGKILDVVPNGIPSHYLLPFLGEDFLPSVLSVHPDAVEIIADWIIRRIHLLDITEKDYWPENGKNLASLLFEIIETLQEKQMSYSTSLSLACTYEKKVNSNSRMGCLYKLLKTLKFLVSLKENFNCKISLTTQDSENNIIPAVLDQIRLKFICTFISDFAKKYALENKLDLNSCLESYIKKTIENSNFTWWSWEDTAAEEHLTLVLDCIADSSTWVNAALFLVSHATVPWSDRVKSIVQQGLNSDHPSKEVFKIQSKQVLLKEVLVKYEHRNFQMEYFHHLESRLIKYIIMQDRDSALEDAKMVILSHADALDVPHYKIFLQAYIHQNKFDKLISLLSTIPSEIAIECSKSLLLWATFYLEDSSLVENDKETANLVIRAGIYFINFLKCKKQPVDTDLLNAFNSMKKLLEEFEISISLTDVKDNAFKIVENFIQSNLDKQDTANQKSQQVENVAFDIFRIKRLGYILDIEESHVVAVLVKNCLQWNKYDLVIKLCGELVSSNPSPQNAETFLEVVNHILENFQNIDIPLKTIISTVCHLSNLAVTYCDRAMIEKCMQAVRLSTYFAVLNKITDQELFILQTDKYYKWKFHPVYQDKGFPLDSSQVGDFISKLVPLFCQSRSLGPGETLSIFKPLICEMKEKSHQVAAIRTMYLFYHLEMENLLKLSVRKRKSLAVVSEDTASSNSDVFITDVGNMSSATEQHTQPTNGSQLTINFEERIEEAYNLIDKDLHSAVIDILCRMVDSRSTDLDLCVGLLSMFPFDKFNMLEKLQNWSSNNLRRMLSLGEIGSECCRLWDNPSKSAEYVQIYQRAQFLLHHNIITPSTAINLNSTDCDYNWTIVKEIILSPKTTLSTVFDCCAAFDLVPYHVLIAYLNNLLIESDKICLRNEILNKDLTLIFNQANCAIEAIANEELIVTKLSNILKKISVYSYEVLIFINEQLLHASANILTFNSGQFERIIELLNFLRVYQRISPPGKIEREHWLSQHPTEMFPVIANKRLPLLTVFNDMLWKIINPELTVNTLETWLRIAPVLKVSKDECAMMAVNNYVMAYLSKLDTKNWMGQDSTFFQNNRMMMDHISDFQKSVVCAHWIANRMPPGGNKTCFAMYAMKLAEVWLERCPNNPEIYSKLKEVTALYKSSVVEEILYRENLANAACLAYVNDPVQLTEFFMLEYFLSVDSSIKACKAAAEISKIIPFNLEEIFCKFFLKWLNHTQTDMDSFNETIDMNSSINRLESEDTNEKNILRIIHLILGTKCIGYNICDTLKRTNEKMTFTQRSRFIFCAVAVYGIQYVAESLNLPVNVLEESLPTIFYSSELEYSQHQHLKGVITSKNVKIVAKFLCNQNNYKTLLCCVRICSEFKLWCSEIWNVLLQKLVAMSLIEPLHDILQINRWHLVHMWQDKSFISAWQCIISNCFNTDGTDPSKVIERLLNTILECPCTNALDIESLWNEFKYFVKSCNGKNLEFKEPVSDFSTFVEILQSLRESC